MTTTRRLAAILAADVAGYSRLMAADEVGTLEALKACRREVVDPAIAAHRGRIVKTTGDGMLVEFASAVDAVTCAMAVQEKMTRQGGNIAFRIGINVGDIIIDGDDIFGDGVNIAARVESECEPGRVYLSDDAFRQLRAKTLFTFDDLGEKTLKNLDRPIRIYAVRTQGFAPAAPAVSDPGKPLPLPDKPSIAVLPFQNMSGDTEQEYFADGLVEDIITALSRFKSLFVIARNSSFTYKGRAVDIKQVGRELGVRYVLEGSVRKAGGRLRLTGQLIDATTGAHLWANKFEGAAESVFELQDRITEEVVGVVYPAVRNAEIERSTAKAAADAGAYDLCLRAQASLRRNSPEGNEAGLLLCRQAIDRDPSYPTAYGLAVGCFAQRKFFDLIGANEITEGRRYAELGVMHGQNDAFTLTHVAGFHGYVLGELDIAAGLYEQAIDLNPNFAEAWRMRGYNNVWLGRYELALSDAEKAMRLDPLDPRIFICHEIMGVSSFFLGRYADALSWALKANVRRPSLPTPRLLAFMAHQKLGQTEEADRIAAQLRAVNPDLTISGYLRHLAKGQPQFIETIVDGLRGAGIPECPTRRLAAILAADIAG
jgi:TolB-like protein/class 3 adenylate cyclase